MEDQHHNPKKDPLDSLERQILDQKGELDIHAPRPSLWDTIEKDLDAADEEDGFKARPKPPSVERVNNAPRILGRSLLYVAASLLMVAGAVSIADQVGLLRQPTAPGVTVSQTNEEESAEFSPLFTELQDVETYYYRLVDDRSEKIRTALDDDGEEALAFLDELAEEYEILKEEAGLSPDKVLSAMINNYRQRIEVLERMWDLLEETEVPSDTRENDKYENYISL